MNILTVLLSIPINKLPGTSFRLHYHRQFGDWDRVDVAANLSSHSLRNLRCGTIYQFFMEAINEFGVGERTDTLTLSTQGTLHCIPIFIYLANFSCFVIMNVSCS